MTDGVVVIAYGAKAEQEYTGFSRSYSYACNHYPVQMIGGDYGAANKPASRRAKVNLFDLSKFDKFVYLDVDTRTRESLTPLFDILADGWDIVICPSSNQDEQTFWHVGEQERNATLNEIGINPLQLQCGVIAVSKNERTRALFQAWALEWMRYSGEDQAAFARALYRAPVKVWMMGYPWNGGAAISHNFGAMR